jgi:ATP-dependent RNA helicase SUPV3L1/SUV3
LGSLGRKSLKPFGIRIGRHWVFIPALLKPRAVALRRILWGLWNSANVTTLLPGRVSVAINTNMPEKFYGAVGYARFPSLAIRCDIVERLASTAWSLSRNGPFTLDGDAAQLMALAGCGANKIPEILSVLGYSYKTDNDGIMHFNHTRPPSANSMNSNQKQRIKNRKKELIKASPFAALQNLMIER